MDQKLDLQQSDTIDLQRQQPNTLYKSEVIDNSHQLNTHDNNHQPNTHDNNHQPNSQQMYFSVKNQLFSKQNISVLCQQMLNESQKKQSEQQLYSSYRQMFKQEYSSNDAFKMQELNDFKTTGELRILQITWNMQGKCPDKDTNVLEICRSSKHHIICISSQENSRSIMKSMLVENKSKWKRLVEHKLGEEYQIIEHNTRNALDLIVFAHLTVYPLIKNVDKSRASTGVGNMIYNKGGLAIGFHLAKQSFLFVSCHLTSGQNKVNQRVNDIQQLEKKMKLEKCHNYLSDNLSERFDHVIWSGDLNFRIQMEKETLNQHLIEKEYQILLDNEQLVNIKDEFGALKSFQEGMIYFPPTYKFQKQKNEYQLDGKHYRIPGWTDRILFKNKDETSMELLKYDSLRQVTFSDHRPVIAQFQVKIPDVPSRLKGDNLVTVKSSACQIF